jgi:hypothetical protein
MNDPKPDEENHPTASATSEPQEEFIEQKPQPSRNQEVANEAPPKEAGEK